MESLSGALKHVSQAVSLDSNGFTQAAFSKYVYSLQVLITYLNSTFTSYGFERVTENKKEVLKALSMIRECSDRISMILNDHNGSPSQSHPFHVFNSNSGDEESKPHISKVNAFTKAEKENAQLFKMYQARIEKAKDNLSTTNLNLEFQRRITENAIIAKKKYDLELKTLQRERMLFMEKEIRKLCPRNEHLNKKEHDKCLLYNKVLQYVKGEMWPCTWKLNQLNLNVYEMAEKIFQKVVSCHDHPLTSWLIMCHSNIQKKIDSAISECNNYVDFVPELNSDTLQLKFFFLQEHCDCILLKYSKTESAIAIPTSKLHHLEDLVGTISSEIKNAILDMLEIFHLVYKSLIPEDSETVFYQIIEKHFLLPLWPRLTLLFRCLNLPFESKLAESMHMHQGCSSCKFSVSVNPEFERDLSSMLIGFLRHQSLVQKMQNLVLVSKKLCEINAAGNNSGPMLGADEMIPLLSYVILHSKMPQLISDCCLLEHLFDMKYMLGEEGYALSSFLAALKCVEMMRLTECNS